MGVNPETAVTVPKAKRKKYYTNTGQVDENRLSKLDVVLAPEVPQDGADSKYFEKRCEALSLRSLVETGAADYILQRPNHPHFLRLLEFVTERSRGKVPDIIKNEHVIAPAVALPPKQPENIPDGQYEVVSDQADPMDPQPGSPERLSSGE